MVTPEILKAAGEALFGQHWHSELAAELGVGDRTMRRWAAGQAEIPPGVAGELAALLTRRHAELGALLDQLKRP